MRIYNHASRVVTVKNTAFEDSIGMEKSIEVADDCFDFDRTLEIGFLTLKQTKSETEVDFVESRNFARKGIHLSVERKVDIPIVTVIELKNEEELHIYEEKRKRIALFFPEVTLWSATCKDAARKLLATGQRFASEKERLRFRRIESLRAALSLPLTLLMIAVLVYQALFTPDLYSVTTLVMLIVTLLLAGATVEHIKSALWAKKVAKNAHPISELDIRVISRNRRGRRA